MFIHLKSRKSSLQKRRPHEAIRTSWGRRFYFVDIRGRLFHIFCGINAQGTHNTEEDFRIIHDTVKVFRAGAFCIQRHIVGCMAFIADGIGNIGRDEFDGITVMMTGRIGFGNDCRYLMVFRLVTDLLSFLLGDFFRNRRRRRFLLEVEIFIISRMVGILDGQGYIGIGIVRESIVVSILECREDRIGIGADSRQTFLSIPFMIGTGDGCAVGMVGYDDDQRIITMFFIPFLGIFDGLIKFNRIVRGTLPVHGVELFIKPFGFWLRMSRDFFVILTRFG